MLLLETFYVGTDQPVDRITWFRIMNDRLHDYVQRLSSLPF